jgi:hypothetical protein
MATGQVEAAGAAGSGDPRPEPPLDPHRLLLAAFWATGAGWALSWISLPWLVPVWVVLVLGGLLAAGGAVTLRYRSGRFWAGAALVAALAFFAMDEDWDTVRLVLGLLAAVALFGAFLAALPQSRRRTVLSLLLLFHLGGLLVAVTLPEPPGADPAYLSFQLWRLLYRPYLDFLHLSSAYNYYSPNPTNEEIVLWIHVRYADGRARWVKIPDREKCRTELDYTRWATLAESISGGNTQPDDLEELEDRRREAAEGGPEIPLLDDDASSQYEEPTARVKLYLASFARHVARRYRHPTDQGQPVTGVKIYRVIHQHLSPEQLRDGMDPTDPTLYLPFYFGEYTADGRLKRSCYDVEYDADGEVVREERDPLLYWVIPILREEDGSLTNYVKIHAGDDDAEDEPWKTP